jgi:hypothetical protein
MLLNCTGVIPRSRYTEEAALLQSNGSERSRSLLRAFAEGTFSERGFINSQAKGRPGGPSAIQDQPTSGMIPHSFSSHSGT